jgi:iron(III) transport system substrate-binding protein
VDPVALLRGAPHREAALAFIEYVMTDGQKLWGWKAEPELQQMKKPPGEPEASWEAGRGGGPKFHALRRLPVLPELYDEKYRAFRSDPDIFPYESAKHFIYHAKWTADLFQTIAFLVRVMSIDTHDELCAAWKALIEAKARSADGKFPAQALAAFENIEDVTYPKVRAEILPVLKGKDKIREIQLAKTLAGKFRENYRRAAELAREGK